MHEDSLTYDYSVHLTIYFCFQRGETPLHAAAAAHFGVNKVVRLLLEAGADVLLTDNRGHKPIDSAIQPEIKLMLQEAEESIIYHGFKRGTAVADICEDED